jgi:hypothetical protein
MKDFLRFVACLLAVSCVTFPLMVVGVAQLHLPDHSFVSGMVGILSGVLTLIIGELLWVYWEMRSPT